MILLLWVIFIFFNSNEKLWVDGMLWGNLVVWLLFCLFKLILIELGSIKFLWLLVCLEIGLFIIVFIRVSGVDWSLDESCEVFIRIDMRIFKNL